MDRITLNINTPIREDEVLLSAGESQNGAIVSVDQELGLVLLLPKEHGAQVGDTLYFRKRSGTGDTTSWETFGECEVKVMSIISDKILVVSIPEEHVTHTIIGVDEDAKTINLENNYALLPEDYLEIWQENGTVLGTLENLTTQEQPIILEDVCPVFRHNGETRHNFDNTYDRSLINTSDISVNENTILSLPTVLKYTYNVYTPTDECEEVLVAVKYDTLPQNDEIDETYPGKIFIESCNWLKEATRTFYQKQIAGDAFDYEKISTSSLFMNYNPYIKITTNYGEGTPAPLFASTELIRKHEYYKVDIGLTKTDENNLFQQSTIENLFSSEIKEKVIPEILDMEKVMFEPTFKDNSGNTIQMEQIDFNFHFRYREVEYKEIEELTPTIYETAIALPTIPSILPAECIPFKRGATQDQSEPIILALAETTGTTYYRRQYSGGWHIDGNHGWNLIPVGTTITTRDAFEKSDLAAYMNFDEDDIRYQKQKVKNSFIRLSFYDNPNPLEQQLLGYSTVFLDSGELYGKYMNLKAKDKDFTIYDEHNDIDTKLIIRDKFNTNKSSEGFYIYLFKNEVGPDEPEKEIYMKVEFNHAGNGRTIPFTRPKFNGTQISHIPFNEYYDYLYVKIKIKYVANTEPHYIYEFDTTNSDFYGVRLDKDNKKTIITLFEPLVV